MHLDGATEALTRLESTLASVRELTGCSIRIWQVTGAGALRPLDPSEARVVETAELALLEGAQAAEVLDTVFNSLASFGGVASDDQTLAVLKG